MDLEHVITAIIAITGSCLGSAFVFYIAWRKLKPEIGLLKASTNHEQAEAASSWAQTGELAAHQLLKTQKQLIVVQNLLIENGTEIAELKISIAIGNSLIKRLIAQIESLGITPVK